MRLFGWIVVGLCAVACFWFVEVFRRPIVTPPSAAAPPVSIKVPPANWNPVTASADELDAYNFPPRPTDPAQLQRWTEVVTKTRWENPTFDKGRTGTSPRLNRAPAPQGPSTLPTQNWGGVVSTATYTAVSGRWRQPYAYADPGQRPAVSTQWIGLGGFDPGAPLVQMGTEARVYEDGRGGYDAWYEIVGTDNDTGGARKINFRHQPGDELFSQIWWTEANGVATAHFYIADTTRGSATSFSVPGITGYDGVTTSAEWINEIPTMKSGNAFLPQPYYKETGAKRVAFTESQAGLVGDLHYVNPGASSTTYVTTHRDETPLQGVSILGAKGDFQTIWKGY